MIDHVTFGVSDFDRSAAFYDRAFAPLGISRLYTEDALIKVAGMGAAVRSSGSPSTATRADVDAFHRAAPEAGGADNGAPGVRPHYHPAYYGSFVRDPDGHNIEAVCHRPD